MRKTILLLLLAVFGFSFAYPKYISVKQKEFGFQHRRARIPAITKVSADYENGLMTLYVTGYTGSIQVDVSDTNGNIVGTTTAYVSCKGTITLDINAVQGELYSLNIALVNTTYVGQFYA